MDKDSKNSISILIANYNNGHFFKDCYESLLAQTHQDFEVVILDDCSTDNSVEVIKSIIGNDERCKLFENEQNRKIGYTKRKLVELATGNICGFLDPDDALTPNAIEKVLNAYQNNTEVGMVYSNFILSDEKLKPISIHKAKQVSSLDSLEYYNFDGEISHFATFRKDIYIKTSGIDPYLKTAEDKDWYMKMCEVALVKYLDEDLYLYRVHDGGISTNKNGDKAYFWHWVALIKMAERRNINIEDLFLEKFVRKEQFESLERKLEEQKEIIHRLKKNRWIRLGNKLGFIKMFKNL